MVAKLYHRHSARGWDKCVMKNYILKADAKLEKEAPRPALATTQWLSYKERLFLHLEYRSSNSPKRTVRAFYDAYCKPVLESTLGIQKFTIAYSRTNDLKDILTQAKLNQKPRNPASKYYSGELITN